MNTPFSKIIENFTYTNDTTEKNISENFTDNVDDLIKETLEQVQRQVLNDSSISYANRNKEIVTILYQKGIFNLKDAVIKIAKLLGISKNTVYMHIRNIGERQ